MSAETLSSWPYPFEEMARRKETTKSNFGRRMSGLRKKAGLTQQELAEALGISRRMVAYYEGESAYAPTALLPKMAELFGVTLEELLATPSREQEPAKPRDTRLLRRLRKIERLPLQERRQIIQFIDAFLERDKLRSGIEG